MMEWVCNYDDS